MKAWLYLLAFFLVIQTVVAINSSDEYLECIVDKVIKDCAGLVLATECTTENGLKCEKGKLDFGKNDIIEAVRAFEALNPNIMYFGHVPVFLCIQIDKNGSYFYNHALTYIYTSYAWDSEDLFCPADENVNIQGEQINYKGDNVNQAQGNSQIIAASDFSTTTNEIKTEITGLKVGIESLNVSMNLVIGLVLSLAFLTIGIHVLPLAAKWVSQRFKKKNKKVKSPPTPRT
ncbi:MAG: hypothetical protein Q7K34_04850 [archaeon]|nr:hypothetical protein [archaeon]